MTGTVNWTRTLSLRASGTCTVSLAATVSLRARPARRHAGRHGDWSRIPVRVVSYPASGGQLTNSATVDTDPNKTGGIDTPGGNNTGSSQVSVTKSSIAGTVFEDRDRAGANGGTPQAAGTEPRIAGVTLTLTGTDAYGNTC